MRENARKIIGDRFIEVYLNSDLDTCIKRDAKGIYKKVLEGKIPNFTGIDSIYEIPENPDLILDTANDEIALNVKKLFDYLPVPSPYKTSKFE